MRALLESHELILRGDISERIALSAIAGVELRSGKLHLDVGGDTLVLALDAVAAEKWAKAMQTPPPSLAKKLGIGPDRKALVRGAIDDPELAAALAGAATEAIAEASTMLVRVAGMAELESAMRELVAAGRPLPIWLVYRKGAHADIAESDIRAFMRARNYVDTKSSAVSERLTAARYSPRKASG